VYDTDTHSFWFFKSAAWNELPSGSSGWSLTGNSLSGPRFLVQQIVTLKFYTNGIEQMRITPQDIQGSEQQSTIRIDVQGNNLNGAAQFIKGMFLSSG